MRNRQLFQTSGAKVLKWLLPVAVLLLGVGLVARPVAPRARVGEADKIGSGRTLDGGATWDRPAQLSDVTTGAPYHTAGGYLFPYGDYMEIAVDGRGRSHVIWGEAFSYIGPGGTWYTRGK